jgi:2'-5' RNA ligase
MRLFIAIPLGEAVEAALQRLTGRLRPSAPDLRWSAPESWHITLQFLGNTTEEQYACLLPRLKELGAAPFAIDFEGLGVFERAGVFFLAVAPAPALVALQKRVVAATQPCGFEPEDRPYHPHITLARSKGRSRPRELRALLERAGPKVHFARIIATEFRLYESHLSAAGSRYEVKCRFLLSERHLHNAK